MKISRIKHVVITSIIFLVIIAIIITAYNGMMKGLVEKTQDQVYRVVAKKDIEPGTEITLDNVERVNTSKIDKQGERPIYRMNKNDNHPESVDEKFDPNAIPSKDDRWAIGKIAKDKIYQGQVLFTNNLTQKKDAVADKTRLYAIPFDSSTTGGYNIELGEKVDICVLYNTDDKVISEYQDLPDNKAIDIVLSERRIADIRDESGNSRKYADGAAVVPGYVCFNLTYDEINKLEIAKRQGTLFVAITANYYKEGSQVPTFMPDKEMPKF